MTRRFRLPMFVVAAAMFGLMAVLATLQYQWLGRISDAERERMRAMLTARATAFAEDFDRELTRAYLLFQLDADPQQMNTAGRLSARYDRWHATARFPRMIGGIYVVSASESEATIERFNLTTRFVEPVAWPENLSPLRRPFERRDGATAGAVLIRPAVPTILEDVPAVVVPTPIILFDQHTAMGNAPRPLRMTYTVLVLDRDYVINDMLPAIAEQHFRGTGEGVEYRLAVVRTAAKEVVYTSVPTFTPGPDTQADVTTDLFQVRTQDFGALAAEVRRFSTFVTERTPPPSNGRHSRRGVVRETIVVPHGPRPGGANAQFSIIMRQPGGLTPAQKGALSAGVTAATAARTMTAPTWKLMVTHPSGSLEAAVRAGQRRSVLVSSGILAVLGASMLLLVVSTRRAQRLAAQQMEFVAAVSHELRTPLAVIRSAGENLADGVVRSDEQVRKYGDLVRSEGQRLTEMVEQTLELAGIQSGRRGFALAPVPIEPLLDDIVESSRALIEEAHLTVEFDVPEALPPVMGDGPALRRVFQNLVANAMKYGARGKWLGLRARADGRDVVVSVIDRGIGIAPAEHDRIFEPFYRTPDVVAAQIQGAGLGLSLVKRIVESHGGRITVRSAAGEGSEFTVRLPAASQQPIADTASGDARQAAAHAATIKS